jgi:hypothetical protein
MKKVCLSIGVGGASALGMIAPMTGANAAATASHTAPNSTGKTVTLLHRSSPRAPDAECGVNAAAGGHDADGLTGAIEYRGSCVGFQSAWVYGFLSSLTERVRYWKSGGIIATRWVNPGTFTTINGHSATRFWSSPYEHVSEVCEALVWDSNHNTVVFPPACERP